METNRDVKLPTDYLGVWEVAAAASGTRCLGYELCYIYGCLPLQTDIHCYPCLPDDIC
jgi:hypothetical protein